MFRASWWSSLLQASPSVASAEASRPPHLCIHPVAPAAMQTFSAGRTSYIRDGNRIQPMPKPIPPLGQPPLTPAVFHILLALADGPRHGYAIMRAVEESAGTEMRMGPGTIYGSLQRMEEAGLVRELSPGGHERRRVFVLQPFGRRALD